MSGKKKPAGKQIALCLLLTAAVDGLGVLLVTLLAVKGSWGRPGPAGAGALPSARPSPGDFRQGRGGWVRAGSLLNAGAFALLLLLLCFGGWGEGIAVRGLIRLALILLGGLLAALLCGKVGKRPNKRLVKSHKKAAFRLEKAPSGGAALLFCGVVRYGKILRGIDTTSCVK